MTAFTFSSESSNYPTNIYSYGFLYVMEGNTNGRIQQIYLPHNLHGPEKAIIAHRMQYDSTQGFTAWAYAYQNDYTSISLNKSGYIVFRNRLIVQWGIVSCNNYDSTTNNMYYKQVPTNVTVNSDYLYGHTNYSNKSDFKKTTFHCINQQIYLGWENDTDSNMSVRWIMLSF